MDAGGARRMQAMASLSMLVVAIVTSVVGFRLLARGLRNGQLPELAFESTRAAVRDLG